MQKPLFHKYGDYVNNECRDCKHHKIKRCTNGKRTKVFHKCIHPHKLRGVGYDLKAHQKACVFFQKVG